MENNKIYFKIETIHTSLSVYDNDTKWSGSLWQNGKMIASDFSVFTCEMGCDTWDEAEYYAEISEEQALYEADPEPYFKNHKDDIYKWALDSCCEMYSEQVLEEGYTEEDGISLEDFCCNHQVGQTGDFNRAPVPEFDSYKDIRSYFDEGRYCNMIWDIVSSLTCSDVYVGDIWGDGSWGGDEKLYDECPQYVSRKIR